MDAAYGLRDDVNILNPTTFALIIKRNLSAGWYKEIPELDVSGRLKSIVVNLMNADYKMIMSILSKNMAEGADERKVPPPPDTKSKSIGILKLSVYLYSITFFSRLNFVKRQCYIFVYCILLYNNCTFLCTLKCSYFILCVMYLV